MGEERIEFRRNKETGKTEVWVDGVKTGEINTMGDEIIKEGKNGRRGQESTG